MKKKLFLRLCLILMVAVTAYSCRTDQFPEHETYNSSAKFQLTSKRISLDEAKHKAQLIPEINKAEAKFREISKTNVNGKIIDYGNGVSIDTDDVIFIENGPDYHTYTFHLKKENDLPSDPVENLVLSPMVDGSYKELLVSYQLTPSEKATLSNGGYVDTTGKTTVTELAAGTYTPLSKGLTSCGWVESYTFMGCSDVHNGVSTHNENNMSDWKDCKADRKPGLYMTMTYRCDFSGMTDDMGNPSNPSGSSGSSGGGSSGTGDPNYDDSGNNTSPCANGGVLNEPQDLTTDPGDGNCSGIPTVINLPDPKLKNKCDKAKAAYENQAVKSSYETLKTKTSEPKETGFGFKKVTNPDGTVTTETFSLNPDATNADGMTIAITSNTFAYTHTHLDKVAGKLAIKIHSPADINTFISILRSAKANGIPLSEVSAGMIASDPDTQYNVYQLIYTGNGNDLPPEFSDTQLAKLRNEFNKEGQRITIETGEPLTHYEMQGIFFKAIKKMNVKNVVLSKREYSTGKYYIVEFDEYGNPTEKPCS